MRYDVKGDGTLAKGRVFYDFSSEREEVALDGVKVDQRGNVYVSAPRGVWILSPEGKALGRIEPPEHDANFAWGDDDARGLYLTASTGLYRVRAAFPACGRRWRCSRRVVESATGGTAERRNEGSLSPVIPSERSDRGIFSHGLEHRRKSLAALGMRKRAL